METHHDNNSFDSLPSNNIDVSIKQLMTEFQLMKDEYISLKSKYIELESKLQQRHHNIDDHNASVYEKIPVITSRYNSGYIIGNQGENVNKDEEDDRSKKRSKKYKANESYYSLDDLPDDWKRNDLWIECPDSTYSYTIAAILEECNSSNIASYRDLYNIIYQCFSPLFMTSFSQYVVISSLYNSLKSDTTYEGICGPISNNLTLVVGVLVIFMAAMVPGLYASLTDICMCFTDQLVSIRNQGMLISVNTPMVLRCFLSLVALYELCVWIAVYLVGSCPSYAILMR